MTNKLLAITVKLPAATLQRIPGNRSRFIREAVAERLDRERSHAAGWTPKSALGRKLKTLRDKSIKQGIQPLSAEAIADELRSRRGGLG